MKPGLAPATTRQYRYRLTRLHKKAGPLQWTRFTDALENDVTYELDAYRVDSELGKLYAVAINVYHNYRALWASIQRDIRRETQTPPDDDQDSSAGGSRKKKKLKRSRSARESSSTTSPKTLKKTKIGHMVAHNNSHSAMSSVNGERRSPYYRRMSLVLRGERWYENGYLRISEESQDEIIFSGIRPYVRDVLRGKPAETIPDNVVVVSIDAGKLGTLRLHEEDLQVHLEDAFRDLWIVENNTTQSEAGDRLDYMRLTFGDWSWIVVKDLTPIDSEESIYDTDWPRVNRRLHRRGVLGSLYDYGSDRFQTIYQDGPCVRCTRHIKGQRIELEVSFVQYFEEPEDGRATDIWKGLFHYKYKAMDGTPIVCFADPLQGSGDEEGPGLPEDFIGKRWNNSCKWKERDGREGILWYYYTVFVGLADDEESATPAFIWLPPAPKASPLSLNKMIRIPRVCDKASAPCTIEEGPGEPRLMLDTQQQSIRELVGRPRGDMERVSEVSAMSLPAATTDRPRTPSSVVLSSTTFPHATADITTSSDAGVGKASASFTKFPNAALPCVAPPNSLGSGLLQRPVPATKTQSFPCTLGDKRMPERSSSPLRRPARKTVPKRTLQTKKQMVDFPPPPPPMKDWSGEQSSQAKKARHKKPPVRLPIPARESIALVTGPRWAISRPAAISPQAADGSPKSAVPGHHQETAPIAKRNGNVREAVVLRPEGTPTSDMPPPDPTSYKNSNEDMEDAVSISRSPPLTFEESELSVTTPPFSPLPSPPEASYYDDNSNDSVSPAGAFTAARMSDSKDQEKKAEKVGKHDEGQLVEKEERAASSDGPSGERCEPDACIKQERVQIDDAKPEPPTRTVETNKRRRGLIRNGRRQGEDEEQSSHRPLMHYGINETQPIMKDFQEESPGGQNLPSSGRRSGILLESSSHHNAKDEKRKDGQVIAKEDRPPLEIDGISRQPARNDANPDRVLTTIETPDDEPVAKAEKSGTSADEEETQIGAYPWDETSDQETDHKKNEQDRKADGSHPFTLSNQPSDERGGQGESNDELPSDASTVVDVSFTRPISSRSLRVIVQALVQKELKKQSDDRQLSLAPSLRDAVESCEARLREKVEALQHELDEAKQQRETMQTDIRRLRLELSNAKMEKEKLIDVTAAYAESLQQILSAPSTPS